MPEDTKQSPLDYLMENPEEIINQVAGYGELIGAALVIIIAGALVIYLLHRLASGYLDNLVNNSRLVRVVFGALYALLVVMTMLVACQQAGLDVSGFGQLAIVVILIGAVIAYFLIPFIPKLPFVPGNTILAHGEMGTVIAISTFHTTLRKFDGTVVFLPNAMIMASKILNFTYDPQRRIQLNVSLQKGPGTVQALETIRERMQQVEGVLEEPPVSVFATGGDARGLELSIYAWVENANFLGAQSALWLELMALTDEDNGVVLSLPQQQIQLANSSATVAD